MKILIVGCGFVGERVARRLAERGESVFATTRKPSRAEAFRAIGIEPVRFDITSPETSDPLPRVDAVFSAVGFDRSTGASMEAIHVEGLRGLLDRLPDSVVRFVYASSTSVYGAGEGGWVTESSPTEPNTEAGRAILRAEELARAWGASAGRSSISLRFSGLYGPGRLINKAALVSGTPLKVDPDGWLNLVHGDDAASASIEALLREEIPTALNVSDDRPILRREYYETAARCLNVPAPNFDPGIERNEGRRVANTLLKRTLLPALAYPDISSGAAATVREERAAAPETGSR